MKQPTVWVVAIFALLLGTASTARAQMVPAGEFDNLRCGNGECVGYELDLWKMNGQLYGTLSCSAGLVGDTPTGYIDHVVWDAQTGKLTFDAKLSIGSDGYGKFSKDFYQFSGTLTPKLVQGKLIHKDMDENPQLPETEAVKLKLDKADTKMMTTYATRDEWLAFYADIMAYRGPKW